MSTGGRVATLGGKLGYSRKMCSKNHIQTQRPRCERSELRANELGPPIGYLQLCRQRACAN